MAINGSVRPRVLATSSVLTAVLAVLSASSFPAVLALSLLAPPVARAQDLTEERRIEVAAVLQRSAVTVQVGRRASGSGFVACAEGWVVTNAHVVAGFRSHPVEIRFGDGTVRAARVLAFDQGRDLSVLEPVGGAPVPPLSLAGPDDVRVGQTVLAYGSPFGLDGTLTQGIVSARRSLPGVSRVENLIQTDAPINPGNSGGPLVNSRGHVIGVNTAILSRTGGSQGIGFAVPVGEVRALIEAVRHRVAEASRQAQRSPRAPASSSASPETPSGSLDGDGGPDDTEEGPVWLGIFGDDFRARGGAGGVRVQRVVPGSPAAEAGLRGAYDPAPGVVRRLGIPWTGHIILAVDGRRVRSMSELKRLLALRRPGQRATLAVTVGPGALEGETIVELREPPREP